MEMNLFPADIILDIISRLPVESIMECRRVCKTWRTLTYRPSFAHLHLCRLSLQLHNDDDDDDDDKSHNHFCATTAAAAAKVGFVSQIELDDEKSQLYCGEYDDQEHESYKTLTKINHPPLNLTSFMLVGSCNGLICLSVRHNGMKDPVYICNPITREYINLPRFTETYLKGYIASGFGYHPKAINEYKVVRIYYSSDQTSMGQVQVYTLGSGRGWRNKGEINYRCRLCPGVLANGALHWQDAKDRKIVSFDLADEEFRLLPPPPCFEDYYKLKVLGGLLCVVHQKEGECVMIWSLKKKKNKKGTSYNMMKEQESESWNWSLELRIEGEDICSIYFLQYYDLFALTKSGEVLLWDNGRCLSRYNLKTTFLETLVNYAPLSKYFYAVPHINSFISLKALGEDAKIIGSAKGVIGL